MKRIIIALLLVSFLLLFTNSSKIVFAEESEKETANYVVCSYYGGAIENNTSIDLDFLFITAYFDEHADEIDPNDERLTYIIDDELHGLDKLEIDLESYRFNLANDEDSYPFTVEIIFDESVSCVFDVYVVRGLTNCIVTYLKGEGSGEMKADAFPEGRIFPVPVCEFVAPEGYIFDCWIDENGTEYYVGFDYLNILSDINLYARYKPLSKINATIHLDYGFGREIQDIVVENTPKHFEVPAVTDEPDGYRFLFWQVKSEMKNAFDDLFVKDDLTLIAIYNKEVEGLYDYMVEYDGPALKIGDKIDLSKLMFYINGEDMPSFSGDDDSKDLVFVDHPYIIDDFSTYDYGDKYENPLIYFYVYYGGMAREFSVECYETFRISFYSYYEDEDYQSFDLLINVGDELTVPKFNLKVPDGMLFDHWDLVYNYEDEIIPCYEGDIIIITDEAFFEAVFTKIDDENELKDDEETIGESPKNKHVGLTVFLSILGVIILAALGFSIYWFVIQKKSFKDLIKALKNIKLFKNKKKSK